MREGMSEVSWIALAIVCLLLPQAAAAQEEAAGPLLWISYNTAEPGKSTELGMLMGTEGAKTYDGLVADGHVMSWGVAQAINHYPGDDWTHLEFVNFRDWSAVGEFVKRFMGAQQAKTEEARKAEAAKWAELTVHGSHYDHIGKHQHLATAGGRPTYISLSTYKTQPGQGPEAVQSMYRKWRAPMMDGLMASGKISAHGVYTRVMHGPEGWEDVTGWYTMADLGAVDAVMASGDADSASRTEEQKAEWLADMQKTFQMPGEENHTDRILVVLHYGSAEPPAE